MTARGGSYTLHEKDAQPKRKRKVDELIPVGG